MNLARGTASTGLPRGLEFAVVALVSVAFAATFGWNFGVGNQTAYLVPSLRFLDPTLLANDWYATRTTHYHPAYGHLAALVLSLDSSGWALAMGLTLAVAFTASSLYVLARYGVGERFALPAYLALVTFASLTRMRGPLGTYVFDGVFQPSTLASAAFVMAVAPFVGGRFLASGLLLAVSVLFHFNIAPFGIAAFGLAHAAIGRENLGRRLLEQLALPTLVWLAFLPLTLRTLDTAPDAGWVRDVFLYVRAPHHFAVLAHAGDFLPLVAWQLIALGVTWPLLKIPEYGPLRRLVLLAVALCLVVWAGVVLAVVSPALAINFSWRLGAHAELLLAAGTVVGLLAGIADAKQRPRRGVAAILVLGVGLVLAFVAYGFGRRIGRVLLGVSVIALGAWVLQRLAQKRPPEAWLSRLFRFVADRRREALVAGASAVLVLTSWGSMERIGNASSLVRGAPRDETSLYVWMRSSTPRDAVFLTPPDMDGFRVHGRRAIVVDWRGVPAVLAEVIEWYRRIEAVTGRPGLRREADLAGYSSLDPRRLETLRQRYGVRYAVVRRERSSAFAGYRRVFENQTFVVLCAEPANDGKTACDGRNARAVFERSASGG